MAIRLGDSIRSKIVDVVTAYISGTGGTAGSQGMLRVYSGTQPGTAGGTSGTLLVTINGLAWTSASNGTSAIIESCVGTSATSGTAGWARLSGTDGSSYIIDGACGETVEDFVIDFIAIADASPVTVTAATIIQPSS